MGRRWAARFNQPASRLASNPRFLRICKRLFLGSCASLHRGVCARGIHASVWLNELPVGGNTTRSTPTAAEITGEQRKEGVREDGERGNGTA